MDSHHHRRTVGDTDVMDNDLTGGLVIRPGDSLVVTAVDPKTSPEDLEEMSARLREAHPGACTVLICGTARVAVFRPNP